MCHPLEFYDQMVWQLTLVAGIFYKHCTKALCVLGTAGSVFGGCMAYRSRQQVFKHALGMGLSWGLPAATFEGMYMYYDGMESSAGKAFTIGGVNGVLWGVLHGGNLSTGVKYGAVLSIVAGIGYIQYEKALEWKHKVGVRRMEEKYGVQVDKKIKNVYSISDGLRDDKVSFPEWLPLYRVSDKEIETSIKERVARDTSLARTEE